MIASVIIYMFLLVTNLFAIQELKTTFALSDTTQVKSYSNFMIVVTSEKVKLYQDKLAFRWEINNQEHGYHNFKFEFNTAYALNNINQLVKINLALGIVETLNIIDDIQSYQIKYPYLWVKTKKHRLYVYDIKKEVVIWDTGKVCNKLFFLAGNEQIGCLNKKTLTLYNSITGKVDYQTKKLNSMWAFDSSDNQGGYFSKGNTLTYLDVAKKQLKKLSFKKEDIKGFIRQKEVIVVDEKNKILACIDTKTKKKRWEYKFKENISIIQNDTNNIIIKDANKYKIINNFSGEKMAEFKLQDIDLDIQTIYSYKDQYYVIANKKTYLVHKD